MSRLTDLQTICRGIAAPLSWSRLAVVPGVSMHIEAARVIVLKLIRWEEEAIERERVAEAAFDKAVMTWRLSEPVKPWREDREYEDAMRTWRAGEPVPLRVPPVK